MTQPSAQRTGLKRGITPAFLLLFIVGDMVGGGIYALVGQVGAVTGGAIWSAFLLALVLAVFTAFSYAELVSKYPQAGGAASYVHRAFKVPFLSFLVAFAVVMSGVTSASALAIAFAGDYLHTFFSAPKVITGLIFIVVVGLINFRGINESVALNAIFTLIELFGLLMIVVIGVAALASGYGEPARAFELKDGASIPLALLSGAALAFYALIGFEDAVNLAEETHDPNRSFPTALFGCIAITGMIYLLVTTIAAMVVPIDQLAGSSAPLLEVIKQGPLAVPVELFSAIALFALANGALINMIMASRLIYGMGDQNVMPAVFARIHARRQTPWVAIIFTSLLAMGLIATGDVGALARTTVLLLLLAFIAVNVAVLVLRQDRIGHDHFTTAAIFPVLGVLVCLGLLTQQGAQTWLLAGALLLLGAALYGINALVKRRLDGRRTMGSTIV
ncbi:MAG: APC family permease [Nitrococcus sp.]|nr:APC family permease [Nitrococcus sp.]